MARLLRPVNRFSALSLDQMLRLPGCDLFVGGAALRLRELGEKDVQCHVRSASVTRDQMPLGGFDQVAFDTGAMKINGNEIRRRGIDTLFVRDGRAQRVQMPEIVH